MVEGQDGEDKEIVDLRKKAEDVTTIKGLKGDLVVNARTCIQKSTLIGWIDFFEKKNVDELLSLMI